MLQDRVILKEDRSFVFSGLDGSVTRGNQLGHGLYRNDTRFLSGYELAVNGKTPILLSTSVDRAYVATMQLVNPALEGAGGGLIPQQSLSIRRTRFMHGGMHERIGIQNCNRFAVDIQLQLRFEADFLDIFEVRGYHPLPLRGRLHPAAPTETGLFFEYEGLDGVRRITEVVFDPLPKITGDRAQVELRLQPQETRILLVDVLPVIEGDEPTADFNFDRALDGLEAKYRTWNLDSTSYATDNEVLDQGLLWHNLEDLRMLCDDLPTGLLPTAGVPWYAVPFGRDALIASLQSLALNPDLAYGSLRFLAAHQGRQVDPYRGEEPGKVMHELRFGELANLHQIPHTPYYGTVDATPLFLVLLVELVNWTGDLELVRELAGNALMALDWIDRYGDRDGDGFVEYTSALEIGLRNQGWKDSADSLTDAEGRPAVLPARLVEVQGYVYQAKSGMARILARLGLAAEAERLAAEADLLRKRFNQSFWMTGRRFYAQALDGETRQVPAITSNPGHCLWSRIVDRRRAAHVVNRLVSPAMFSGWGIRTLSTDAPSYNPMSYHNGSVWPHDNSIIAEGMRRYGFRDEAELVARSVLEACMRLPDSRIPELFCGFARDRRFNSPPGEYILTCSPQAWGAGALFHLLRVMLGLEADILDRKLRIDPLETCLYSRIRVEGLRVAEHQIDFTVDQTESGVRVKVDHLPPGLSIEVPL